MALLPLIQPVLLLRIVPEMEVGKLVPRMIVPPSKGSVLVLQSTVAASPGSAVSMAEV